MLSKSATSGIAADGSRRLPCEAQSRESLRQTSAPGLSAINQTPVELLPYIVVGDGDFLQGLRV